MTASEVERNHTWLPEALNLTHTVYSLYTKKLGLSSVWVDGRMLACLWQASLFLPCYQTPSRLMNAVRTACMASTDCTRRFAYRRFGPDPRRCAWASVRWRTGRIQIVWERSRLNGHQQRSCNSDLDPGANSSSSRWMGLLLPLYNTNIETAGDLSSL